MNLGLFRTINNGILYSLHSIYNYFQIYINQCIQRILPHVIKIIQILLILLFIISTSFFITLYLNFITKPITTIKHPVYFDYISDHPNGKMIVMVMMMMMMMIGMVIFLYYECKHI